MFFYKLIQRFKGWAIYIFIKLILAIRMHNFK